MAIRMHRIVAASPVAGPGVVTRVPRTTPGEPRENPMEYRRLGRLVHESSVLIYGAAARAKDEGLVGDIGITGHGDQAGPTHLEALRRFPFATVLTPLNPVLWRDPAFRDAYRALADEVRRQDAGLMTIKTASQRNWPDAADQTHSTWYEPLTEAERIRAAVSWVLAHDEITGLATAGDVRLLPLLVDAERDRLAPDDALAVLDRDAEYASPFLSMPF